MAVVFEDFNKYRWAFEEPSETVFLDITKQLKKVASRKRKQRHALVESAVNFFGRIVKNEEAISQLGDNIEIEIVEDFVIEGSKILFQLLEEEYDAIQLSMDFTGFVCLYLEYLQGKFNYDIFLDVTKKLHVFYLTLVTENPDSWKHVLVIGGPMELISFAMFSANSKGHWLNFCKDLMLICHKSIASCGDFECQRTLLVFLLNWLEKVTPDVKEDFVRESFRILPVKYRERLIKDFVQYDADVKCRYFLNALNGALIQSNRLNGVFSILCTHLFLEGRIVEAAKHNQIPELWVDFSCKSRRIHFYCSFPNNEWVNISIRQEQIESVCVFYRVSECQMQNSIGFDTQEENVDSECYLHLLLNCGFNSICEDSSNMITEDIKSLVFEFKDVDRVEQILEFFNFDSHECDSETRRRLVVDVHQRVRSQPSRSVSPESAIPQPSSHESEILKPSSSESAIPQPSSHESEILKPSSSESAITQASSLESVIPQPSSPELAIPQPSSSESVISQPLSPESVIPQPSSLESVIPQPSSPVKSISSKSSPNRLKTSKPPSKLISLSKPSVNVNRLVAPKPLLNQLILPEHLQNQRKPSEPSASPTITSKPQTKRLNPSKSKLSTEQPILPKPPASRLNPSKPSPKLISSSKPSVNVNRLIAPKPLPNQFILPESLQNQRKPLEPSASPTITSKPSTKRPNPSKPSAEQPILSKLPASRLKPSKPRPNRISSSKPSVNRLHVSKPPSINQIVSSVNRIISSKPSLNRSNSSKTRPTSPKPSTSRPILPKTTVTVNKAAVPKVAKRVALIPRQQLHHDSPEPEDPYNLALYLQPKRARKRK